MSSPALISAVILLGLFHPYRSTVTQTYGEGEWVLTVKTDGFTHQTRCTLVNHHGRYPDVTAVPGALAFRFSPKIDTSNAWYRIGDGPPQAARDAIAKLVVAGSLALAERLDNPTGGVVLIPLDKLKGADEVSIQPVSRSSPRVIKFGPIWTLSNAGNRLGCEFMDGMRGGANGSQIEPIKSEDLR